MSYYPMGDLGASASVSANISIGGKGSVNASAAAKIAAEKKKKEQAAKKAAEEKKKADAKRKAAIEASRKASAAAASKAAAAAAKVEAEAKRKAAIEASRKASADAAARGAASTAAAQKAAADAADPNVQNVTTTGTCQAGKVLYESRGTKFCVPPAKMADIQKSTSSGPASTASYAIVTPSVLEPSKEEPKSNLPLKIAVGGLIAAGALTLLIAAS